MKIGNDIIIVTHRFYPIIGGAENQARLLAMALAARGRRVTVLTGGVAGLPHKETLDGVQVVRLNRYDKEHRYVAFLLLFNLRVLGYLLPRLRSFGCVLYFFAIDLFGFSALALRLLGKQTVARTATPSASEIGGAYRTVRGYRLRRMLTAAFSRFAAISSEVAANLADEGIVVRRIVRARNGVDTTRFFPLPDGERRQLRRQLGLEEERLYLLFCGHFYKTKGLDFLLDGLTALGERRTFPQVELLVLGGSQSILSKHSIDRDVTAQLQRQPTAMAVRFLGQRTDRERYFQAADVFVLPSQSEGMPNALLEAMACGLACVSTPVGGVTDVLRIDSRAVLTAPYGDREALGTAIAALLDDNEQRRALGARAAALAKERYSISAVAQEWEQILSRKK
jgi:glycosyltransferase involved in cell wall biosynthesis